MGVERVVNLPAGGAPSWPAVRDRLAAAGAPPALRMIDGLPAFPDEVPADDWRELRIGLPAGMVTVRRDGPGTLRVVTWGTDDPALAAAADQVAVAFGSPATSSPGS